MILFFFTKTLTYQIVLKNTTNSYKFVKTIFLFFVVTSGEQLFYLQTF